MIQSQKLSSDANLAFKCGITSKARIAHNTVTSVVPTLCVFLISHFVTLYPGKFDKNTYVRITRGNPSLNHAIFDGKPPI